MALAEEMRARKAELMGAAEGKDEKEEDETPRQRASSRS
jgi:hypothetical protein